MIQMVRWFADVRSGLASVLECHCQAEAPKNLCTQCIPHMVAGPRFRTVKRLVHPMPQFLNAQPKHRAASPSAAALLCWGPRHQGQRVH